MTTRVIAYGIFTLKEETWLKFNDSMATAICLTAVLNPIAIIEVNINYELSINRDIFISYPHRFIH